MLRVIALTFLFSVLQVFAQEGRNISQYNLTATTGLKGHDPVAVFPEGGGLATPGRSELSVHYEGVTYLFSSEKNLTLFRRDPSKYEPTYGGWCAYAMANGSQVDIQPEIFTINNRRAHYFVSKRAKQNFDAKLRDYEAKADENWLRISGESPRK